MDPMLSSIHSPDDIRHLNVAQSRELAKEIRRFLVRHVSQTGGHLSSNLGVVELTIALHQSFNAPKDKIVFDVGHQAYVHKMLTGRMDRFNTLRQKDGLAGFPKSEESPYDVFDTGHASTSISAAYGLAVARDLKGEDYEVVAVIGDGSMTGGMAYEAMNNAGRDKTRFIVVLNDNGMSIGHNVGSLANHLGWLRTRSGYLNSKKRVRQAVAQHPVLKPIYDASRIVKNRVKYLMVKGILFEELGFTYLGPVDGHDIRAMREAFQQAKNLNEPVLVHVLTKKGKGYKPAEEHPTQFHGIGPFDIKSGEAKCAPKETYANVFGSVMSRMEKEDLNVVLITAAMKTGTGLDYFSLDSRRSFDVGIAEEHAVTFAAGLAKGGMKPYVAIYSSFLQRAYDQILHDVALQKLPVTFAIDHSGVVGEDGETHQGIFDFAYLSHIPGMVIMAPSSKEELEQMLELTRTLGKPAAIRYPKGAAESRPEIDAPIELGKGLIVRQTEGSGKKIALLSVGTCLAEALGAADLLSAEGYAVTVADARFVKPLDEELLKSLSQTHDLLMTLEDHVKTGGFGMMAESKLIEWESESPAFGLGEAPKFAKVKTISLPDAFLPQDERKHMLKTCGLDASSIALAARKALGDGGYNEK